MFCKSLLTMLALAVALSSAVQAQDGPPDPARKDKEKVEAQPPADRGPAAEGERPRGPREGGPEGDPNQPRPRRPMGPGNPNPDGSSNPDGRRMPGPPRDGFQPNPGGPGPGGPGPRGPGMIGHGFGGPHPQDLERLKESDPEMYKIVQGEMELERESHDLGEQFRRAAAGEARDEIKKRLVDVVERHFQVRSERRELEVKRLEEQVARLRDSMTKRTEQKKEIVERRLSELMGKEYEIGF